MSTQQQLLSAGDLALVTGASGFIASYVIRELIQKGYKVRATVRSLQNTSKFEHMSKLFPQVELVEADLEKEHSFDNAVKGVKVVFHCASPAGLGAKDPQREMVDFAINATLNILRSAEQEQSVRRVVLTSTCGSVASYNKSDDYVFSEKDWNEDTSLTNMPAQYAVTVAERAALDFAKGKHFDLIVINPNGVVGVPLSNRIESSVRLLKGIIDGTAAKAGGVMSFAFAVVTVQDVAAAQILAAEKREANGRYIIAGKESITLLEIANLVKATGKFDKFQIPSKELGGPAKRRRFDASKVTTDLGLRLHDLEEAKEEILKLFDFFVTTGVVTV